MGPLYYISKMTKNERREDSPNDHFIPLTDQTNRRMLFDGHKQKLFGMSSIVLVAPKMPPTNRADQQRTWTRLTYTYGGWSSFSPVPSRMFSIKTDWCSRGIHKRVVVATHPQSNPSSSWLKSSSQKPQPQLVVVLASEPLYSYARSNVYTRPHPRSTILSSSLSCSSHIIILTRTLIAVADSSEYPPSQ